MVAGECRVVFAGSLRFERHTIVSCLTLANRLRDLICSPARYLLNGNVMAARVFIVNFVDFGTAASLSLRSSFSTTPLVVPSTSDEVVFTSDQIVNFCQLAVRTCQRAQGAANRKAQEAWIRLSGTYLSRGLVLSKPEIRRVRYPRSLATYSLINYLRASSFSFFYST